jgi:Fe-only nitrogenase accessory protein AnfO
MMDIAVVMDTQGRSSAFGENTIIRIYSKGEGGWIMKDEMNYRIGQQKTPVGIRNGLKEVGEWLGECKLMIASEISGIYYTYFEGLQFNIWEMEGNPEEYLDYVYHSELEEQKKETVQMKPVTPVLVRDASYYIDLKEIMSDKTLLTSKQVLLPFFKEGKFKQIIIDCDHIPRWFENELEEMNLRAEVQKFRDGMKVTVFNDVYEIVEE